MASAGFGLRHSRSATICEPHLMQNRRSLPCDDSKLDNSSSRRSQRKDCRGTGMTVENAAPWVLRQVEQWQWMIGPAGHRPRRRPNRKGSYPSASSPLRTAIRDSGRGCCASTGEIGFHGFNRASDIVGLLSDRRDALERRYNVIPRSQPRDDPGREIYRRETPAGSRDVALCIEGLVDHRDAGFGQPSLCVQIRTYGEAVEQSESGEQQRP